ncbi:MAG: 4Fe-4S ferredoxin, partial [Spirochaetae bacterium HGW-Spirochaetae-5]
TELFLTLKNTSRLRVRIWAGFSVIFFLQFILGISGIDQFLMTGNLHIPVPAVIVGGPVYRGNGFFMMILFFVTIAAAGPAWCSYFCYFGAWDNVAAGKVKRTEKCGSIPPENILIRILILAIIVLTAYLFRLFSVSEIAAAAAAICFGLTGLIIMRMISAKRGVMIHCTSYCPIGLIATLAGKISPFRIGIEKTCSSCMACSRVCRYGALGQNEIRSHKPGLTCTLCGDCVNVCHNNSIHYKFFGLSPETVRAFFTVIVVSIHAVFLGFARI